MQIHPENSPALNMQNGQGQVVMVYTMHPAVTAVLVAAVIIAVVFAAVAWMDSANTREQMNARTSHLERDAEERSARLLNDFQFTRNKVERLVIEVDNNNGILMRAGLKTPADMARGPAGNLTYQPPKR
jgi:Flp pilus assembly protein TadB